MYKYTRCICVSICINTSMRARTHEPGKAWALGRRTHARTHAHKHKYLHVHIHAYACTYKHIHIQNRPGSQTLKNVPETRALARKLLNNCGPVGIWTCILVPGIFVISDFIRAPTVAHLRSLVDHFFKCWKSLHHNHGSSYFFQKPVGKNAHNLHQMSHSVHYFWIYEVRHGGKWNGACD